MLRTRGDTFPRIIIERCVDHGGFNIDEDPRLQELPFVDVLFRSAYLHTKLRNTMMDVNIKHTGNLAEEGCKLHENKTYICPDCGRNWLVVKPGELDVVTAAHFYDGETCYSHQVPGLYGYSTDDPGAEDIYVRLCCEDLEWKPPIEVSLPCPQRSGQLTPFYACFASLWLPRSLRKLLEDLFPEVYSHEKWLELVEREEIPRVFEGLALALPDPDKCDDSELIRATYYPQTPTTAKYDIVDRAALKAMSRFIVGNELFCAGSSPRTQSSTSSSE
ncbi:hypothetical protein F5X96DRAFT_693589 [Biscogniauxia mediterranea]|nr:hypothetical protein F5X96DRAFT_693589 [Biscogniauxia mediterranea]